MKNFVLAFMVFVTLYGVASCEKRHEGEKAKIETFEQELFQFGNVFTTRYVFEDKNYFYISSSGEGENIKRMDKKTKEIEDLNVSGFGLTVYKNYLYYLLHNKLNFLYRIDLDGPGGEPELVHDETEPNAINYYYIANDAIWLYPAYRPTCRIEIDDFSKKTKYSYDMPENYFMAGIDEKYRYIFVWEIENGKHTYTLARCLHEDTGFENQEYLFVLNQPEWADLRFNDFLAIHGGFAYYRFGFAIYRCALKAGAKSETIYEVEEFGEERFSLIAVTDEGIYITKFHYKRESSYERTEDDCIYRLDHNGENETALNYRPDLMYFVSVEDGRLKYIENGEIYSVNLVNP